MTSSPESIILPSSVSKEAITYVTPMPGVTLSMTDGLVREVNEDRVGFSLDNAELRLSMSDGHWGDAAAEKITEFFLHTDRPQSRDAAVVTVKRLEKQLWQEFGGLNSMDSQKDFTPEASFVSTWFDRGSNKLCIVSYGDVRCLVVKASGELATVVPTEQTWIGAFSYLGLRDRVSVEDSLQFQEYSLQTGDRVLVFSDGIDECVYETPTISLEHIAQLSVETEDSKEFSEKLFKEVFSFGAEDNASLATIFLQ
jgi:serine/threonine protein phosphatase PrpC